MGMGSSSKGIASEINITPLVDVLLVLLIIFMVAQPMVQRGYDSAIPRPDSTPPPPPDAATPPSFVLRLSADKATGGLGEVKLNLDSFARSELKERVRIAMGTVANPQDRVIFIDCADDVRYDDLMQAVDDARDAGVKTVGFATEPIPQ